MPEPQTIVRPLPKGETSRTKISVVVPMLNEERGLGPLAERLRPRQRSDGIHVAATAILATARR